ncbi:MAG: zf-HC2 domain-containing protein, partial [Planctomycetaceae bacterium]|nr:zf-HC2 domain-containing protein [Planctomycetaceae bacterium]
MSESIHPDDPRLTDYVLGELSDDQREAVEAHLAASPESRRAVEELQGLTAQLFEALQAEPTPALTDEQRAAIHAVAATVTNNSIPRVAIRGRVDGRQRVAGDRSHKRAAIAALLAVVTVSAAVVAVITLPSFTPPQTHSVAARFLDQKTDLLALSTDSLTRFDTDPTGGRVDFLLPHLSTRSEHDAPPSVVVMPNSGQSSELPVQLGEQSVISSPTSSPTGHVSRNLTLLPESSERSGPASLAIVASPLAGTFAGGGIGGGVGGLPPAAGVVIVENFSGQSVSQSGEQPTPLTRWNRLTDGIQQAPAGSVPVDQPVVANGNGVVELRQLTENAPAAAGQFPAANESSRPMLGKPVAAPLLAANGAAPAAPQVATTLGREASQWARQSTNVDVQFRHGSFELGVPQSGDATVMSNAMTPQVELLIESLSRRQEKTVSNQFHDVEQEHIIANVGDTTDFNSDFKRWMALAAQHVDTPEDGSRVRNALSQEVSLSFNDVSLADVLRGISGSSNLKIVIDDVGLSDAGISTTTPVTI